MSRLNFDPCGPYRLTSYIQPYINHGRTSLGRSPTSPFSPNTHSRSAVDTEQCILVILTASYVTAKIIQLLFVSQQGSVRFSHVSSANTSTKTKLHCLADGSLAKEVTDNPIFTIIVFIHVHLYPFCQCRFISPTTSLFIPGILCIKNHQDHRMFRKFENSQGFSVLNFLF